MKFLNLGTITKYLLKAFALFSRNGTPSQRKTFNGTASKMSTRPTTHDRTALRKPSVHDLERLAAAEKKRQRRMERNKNG